MVRQRAAANASGTYEHEFLREEQRELGQNIDEQASRENESVKDSD